MEKEKEEKKAWGDTIVINDAIVDVFSSGVVNENLNTHCA